MLVDTYIHKLDELAGLEKCILWETERKALKWYIIAYIEVYYEVLSLEQSFICRLN